jgi:hypothetical protein
MERKTGVCRIKLQSYLLIPWHQEEHYRCEELTDNVAVTMSNSVGKEFSFFFDSKFHTIKKDDCEQFPDEFLQRLKCSANMVSMGYASTVLCCFPDTPNLMDQCTTIANSILHYLYNNNDTDIPITAEDQKCEVEIAGYELFDNQLRDLLQENSTFRTIGLNSAEVKFNDTSSEGKFYVSEISTRCVDDYSSAIQTVEGAVNRRLICIGGKVSGPDAKLNPGVRKNMSDITSSLQSEYLGAVGHCILQFRVTTSRLLSNSANGTSLNKSAVMSVIFLTANESLLAASEFKGYKSFVEYNNLRLSASSPISFIKPPQWLNPEDQLSRNNQLRNALKAIATLVRVVNALVEKSGKSSANEDEGDQRSNSNKSESMATKSIDSGRNTRKTASFLLPPLQSSKSLKLNSPASTEAVERKKGNNVHVPFRDSCLTRLLRPSLDGNCFLSMITIPPHNVENTSRVLRFASQISGLHNIVWIKEALDSEHLRARVSSKAVNEQRTHNEEANSDGDIVLDGMVSASSKLLSQFDLMVNFMRDQLSLLEVNLTQYDRARELALQELAIGYLPIKSYDMNFGTASFASEFLTKSDGIALVENDGASGGTVSPKFDEKLIDGTELLETLDSSPSSARLLLNSSTGDDSPQTTIQKPLSTISRARLLTPDIKTSSTLNSSPLPSIGNSTVCNKLPISTRLKSLHSLPVQRASTASPQHRLLSSSSEKRSSVHHQPLESSGRSSAKDATSTNSRGISSKSKLRDTSIARKSILSLPPRISTINPLKIALVSPTSSSQRSTSTSTSSAQVLSSLLESISTESISTDTSEVLSCSSNDVAIKSEIPFDSGTTSTDSTEPTELATRECDNISLKLVVSESHSYLPRDRDLPFLPSLLVAEIESNDNRSITALDGEQQYSTLENGTESECNYMFQEISSKNESVDSLPLEATENLASPDIFCDNSLLRVTMTTKPTAFSVFSFAPQDSQNPLASTDNDSANFTVVDSLPDRNIIRSYLKKQQENHNVEVKSRKKGFTREEDALEDDDDDLSPLERRFLRCVATCNITGTMDCIHHDVNIHVKNNFERDAMQIAARHGSVAMLAVIYQHGGSLSSRGPKGDTLLQLAAYNGHVEVMRWLLEKSRQFTDAVDMYGQTVVHIAARRGELAVLHYLYHESGISEDLFTQEDFDGRRPVEYIPRRGPGELQACRDFFEKLGIDEVQNLTLFFAKLHGIHGN